MNWYIGQEIVCLKSHSQGMVKKGDIFHIHGLKKLSCCGKVVIDVIGIHDDNIATLCICGAIHALENTYWLHEFLFAPLADISELKEILEKQPEKEKA